jgi:hypothetical protein
MKIDAVQSCVLYESTISRRQTRLCTFSTLGGINLDIMNMVYPQVCVRPLSAQAVIEQVRLCAPDISFFLS